MNFANRHYLAIAGIAWLLFAATAVASVNKSVTIEDGEQSDGASSVNGSVTVGEDATVSGELSTVNGKISIGDRSRIEDARTVNGGIRVGTRVTATDLETVNGSIRIEDEGQIDGSVTAVNGSIQVDGGSRIGESLSNVNGEIVLNGSEIGGDVSTVSGDVELADAAVVKGDLVVEKPRNGGWFNNNEGRPPKIVIGPGSRVEGVLRLEREVKLYISESASVGGVEGVMSMEDAVRFSGTRP
jgi:DUF4097 and DUF4098 domain-containing protein YvlB